MISDQPYTHGLVRSKGQVTLRHNGSAGTAATIRDVGVSAIGLLAAHEVMPGSYVSLDSHGHVAEGVVARCEAEGAQYYIAIDLLPACRNRRGRFEVDCLAIPAILGPDGPMNRLKRRLLYILAAIVARSPSGRWDSA